jgi:hypothetical protein
MAQIKCGTSSFNWDWEDCENDLLVLLQEAADRLAMSGDGENAPTPDIVVAAFVGQLAWQRKVNLMGRRPKRPLRFFGAAVTPRPVHESYAVIAFSTRQRQMCAEVVGELMNIVSPATEEWALGDPEDPDPREVLRRILEMLWSKRLIPRPPCDAYPRGI